jgi:hypothetical protein
MTAYPNELLDMERVAILQAVLVVAGLAVGLVWGRKFGTLPRMLWLLDRLTVRPWLPPLVVAVVAFVGSAVVGNLVRWPHPSVHDEFGYLLIADTFHNGRLTNPTPEHWEHFEAIHMIMRPTYQSKYPPGTGLMIFLGMLIMSSKPAVGVWLSIAFASSATTWLQQAITNRRWALIGGLVAAMQFGFFSMWSQSYWGGCTAMLGGALMLGATARLMRHGPSPAQSLILGAGLFILSITRPYEGLVASLPIAVWLLVALWRWLRADETRARAVQMLLAQVVAAVVILASNGIYNHAVTGSALRMPYQEYQRQYSQVPEFIGGDDMQPERRPARFDRIYGSSQAFYETRQGIGGVLRGHLPRVLESLLWLSSVALVIPVLVGAWTLCRRKHDWLMMTSFGVTLLATGMTFGLWPHYFAPAASMFIVCATFGLRRMWSAHPAGKGLAIGAVAGLVATIASGFLPAMQNHEPIFGQVREETIRDIRRVKGRHLVFVEYSPQSNPFCDWVFNGADIDSQRIIWAMSLGEGKDAALIAKYPDRNVWVYDADAWDFRVRAE